MKFSFFFSSEKNSLYIACTRMKFSIFSPESEKKNLCILRFQRVPTMYVSAKLFKTKSINFSIFSSESEKNLYILHEQVFVMLAMRF